ncbi:4-hydroxyphenylacetate 3-hydroxylase N-terminal domain-containing protein [Paraburkholderia phenazinium]|jgi:4-hydroxyphenylacetate 3-monooxygenase|uniref:4-hydroxyphenylacetate 3-monooxygenase n=1 Tax=Paraburkholderia phenazinium TaxID=60549 RepID=A0A1G8JH17_9BURK|nr:4-hydroxyphenylacetate 3-hydroxylase N-terminal domain-containing protein [Paraburkholderia phenazinium]SDI29920.1 4-hydroxyphenylacetate 3-monooxygenase [Paraburkholderia phenazinium]
MSGQEEYAEVAVGEKPTTKGFLKSGEEFKQSLRDGRVVLYQGEEIDDVTTHFATAGGIAQIAEIYDEQQDEGSEGLLTYQRPDGNLAAMSYMAPRTKEDLARRRNGIKYVAQKTWGTHCRGLDMIASFPVGMLGYLPSFKKHCPEYAENIVSYLEYAEQNNLYLSETIVDPQGFRGRAGGTAVDLVPPERAVMRITKENSKGIWISGVKGVGTVAPQCNEIFVGSLHPPTPDEALWAFVPANAPGIRMFCREVVHRPGTSAHDHPLTSKGEEAEAMVAFDNVFIPRERVMAARTPAIANAGFFNLWTVYSHWYTLVRIEAKAELYAGLAKVILEVLELEHIPVVRQRVSEIVQFAEIIRGMCLASLETATMSEGGLLVPGSTALAAGRVFAMEKLPRILHILRDLCGQGLILRFHEKDLAQHAAFGQKFEWFLDTQRVSAAHKNVLMNLVWDVAASEHATRSLVFEEQHALSEPLLRDTIVRDYDYSEHANLVRNYIGLPPAPLKG